MAVAGIAMIYALQQYQVVDCRNIAFLSCSVSSQLQLPPCIQIPQGYSSLLGPMWERQQCLMTRQTMQSSTDKHSLSGRGSDFHLPMQQHF